jgi:hypothetical protein
MALLDEAMNRLRQQYTMPSLPRYCVPGVIVGATRRESAAIGKLKVARDFLLEMRKNPFMLKSRLVAFLIKELRELVPPTVFFAVGFNLILLTTKLLLADYRVHFANFMVATMTALIVGKSVLVANAMQFLRHFDTAPKILPVLFKTTVYWAVVFLVRFVEKLVEYLLAGGALSAIPEYVATHFTWDRFAAIQIWIFVLFLVYTSIAELNGRLGHGELVKIFFTRHSAEMKSTRPAADSRVRQARPENRDR